MTPPDPLYRGRGRKGRRGTGEGRGRGNSWPKTDPQSFLYKSDTGHKSHKWALLKSAELFKRVFMNQNNDVVIKSAVGVVLIKQ